MQVIVHSNLPKIKSNSFKNVFQQNISVDNATEDKHSGNYKKSKYNIIKFFEDNNTVIYNTASGAVLLLNRNEYNEFESFKDGTPLTNEILIEFENEKLLIPINQDENVVLDIIRQQQIVDTGNEIKIAINTTYDCNARCEYCFECNSEHRKMTKKVATEVANYICNCVTTDDIITYRWFGGEPLMAIDIIDYIIDTVNKHFENKIKYRSVILSNGTIMSDSILEKILGKWNVYEFHVTIDGKKEEHNLKKHFVSPNFDGYSKTIFTIQTLINHDIRVACRINIDKKNICNFDEILQSFDDFENKKYLNVYVAPVRKHTKECESYCFDYSEYNDVFDELYDKLVKHSLLTNVEDFVPKRKVTCCSTRATNELVVDTKGNLFKCMQTATNDQYAVGSCKAGLEYNSELKKWIIPETHKECTDCIYMPICQGGCKGFRSLNNPLISSCIMEKYFMDTILKYAKVVFENGD